jgi:hypothetical protein
MKKSIFIIIVSLFVVFAFSCGNKSTNQPAETHAHSDGTVHEGSVHNEATEAIPEQESFEVDADSSAEHTHDHDNDHSHSHDHQH